MTELEPIVLSAEQIETLLADPAFIAYQTPTPAQRRALKDAPGTPLIDMLRRAPKGAALVAHLEGDLYPKGSN